MSSGWTTAPCRAGPWWSGSGTARNSAAACSTTRTRWSPTRFPRMWPDDGVTRLPGEWALQVPNDYRDVLRHAVPAAIADAGIDPAAVVGIATDFTACTMVPVKADGTPLNEVPGFANRPHAYVKLWRHHAAQAQADRINALAAELGETWLPALWRADLLRMGVRQGAAAAGGRPGSLRGNGPLGGGGGLDRLAALRQLRPQRLHRRLQGHLPGRPLPVRGLPGRPEPAVQGLRQRQAGPHHRPARRRRRLPDRRGRRLDRAAGGHRRRRGQRGRPRHRSGGQGRGARASSWPSWAPPPATS